MKQRTFHIGVALVALLCSGAVSRAHAQSDDQQSDFTCTLQTLAGTYGFTGTGTKPGVGPVASVGTFTFDGAGNVSNHFTQSNNGVITLQISRTGTYTVATDCTGSWALLDGQTANLVILGKGNELMWIRTNPGFVITAIAKKLSTRTSLDHDSGGEDGDAP